MATAQQLKQFENFGCVSRSILAVYKTLVGPITLEQYIDNFSPIFPQWATHCGGLNTNMMFEVSRQLLGTNWLQTYRRQERVRAHFNAGQAKMTLLITELNAANPGDPLTDFIHCQVVSGATAMAAALNFLRHDIGPEFVLLPGEAITDEFLNDHQGYFCVFQ